MGKSKDLATGAAYQDQTESDARYVNVSGDTMTGDLGIGGTATDANWNTATYGNREVAIDGGGGYGVLHLRGDGSGSTNTRYSMGVGDGIFYMAYDDVANVHRIQINSSGHVTMPSQPAFAAYTATGNNAANITFGNTFFNIGSHFVASTGIFTAPVAGRYLFTWHALHTQSPTSYARVLFKINGSTDTQFGDSLTSDGNGIYVNTALSGIINLSANDTVRLYNEGNTIYGSQYAMFSGCLLG